MTRTHSDSFTDILLCCMKALKEAFDGGQDRAPVLVGRWSRVLEQIHAEPAAQ